MDPQIVALFMKPTVKSWIFNLGDAVIPGEHAFFSANDNLLLCSQVFKRKNKSPVKISLSCQ